jgi:hypothetical protein
MSLKEIAHYRRKAEECREKAARAKDSTAQFEWITMAKSWEILAVQAEKEGA